MGPMEEQQSITATIHNLAFEMTIFFHTDRQDQPHTGTPTHRAANRTKCIIIIVVISFFYISKAARYGLKLSSLKTRYSP
jgi:hypothetical protein